MLYLLTDQNDKSWRDVQWGQNVTHEENNSNYHFCAYDSLLIASYMYPAYDGFDSPKCWEAVGEQESQDQRGFRKKFAKLTTLKEIPLQIPTIEQRMSFAILCAMNLILHPVFRTWALNYLSNVDRTQKTAHAVSNELINQFDKHGRPHTNLPPDHEYCVCAYPVLAAVMLDQLAQFGLVAEFCAMAAQRAYFDSLKNAEPLNLERLAQIANIIPANEIAQILE